MRVIVDFDLCQSHALCTEAAPEIFEVTADGMLNVKIEQPDEKLRPDMSVRITFLREAKPAPGGEGAVLAPRAAVRSEAGASYVWVVTQGRLRRQAVETGGDAGSGRVIVTQGLAGGEALVVSDATDLAEGDAVETAK